MEIVRECDPKSNLAKFIEDKENDIFHRTLKKLIWYMYDYDMRRQQYTKKSIIENLCNEKKIDLFRFPEMFITLIAANGGTAEKNLHLLGTNIKKTNNIFPIEIKFLLCFEIENVSFRFTVGHIEGFKDWYSYDYYETTLSQIWKYTFSPVGYRFLDSRGKTDLSNEELALYGLINKAKKKLKQIIMKDREIRFNDEVTLYLNL